MNTPKRLELYLAGNVLGFKAHGGPMPPELKEFLRQHKGILTEIFNRWCQESSTPISASVEILQTASQYPHNSQNGATPSHCGDKVEDSSMGWRWAGNYPNWLDELSASLTKSELVGLDTETTGLDPRRDRVRLLTLATANGVWIVDCFALDPSGLFSILSTKTIVGHNLLFDLGFLARLGYVPGMVIDTMIASKLLYGSRGGIRHTLAACVERELGKTLDKELQRSDWSGTLSPEQLQYASDDVTLLIPLYQKLNTKIRDAHMGDIADLEQRALLAVSWMAQSGVACDGEEWTLLAMQAQEESLHLYEELDAAAPPSSSSGMFGGERNWDSPQQVLEALHAAGCKVEDTQDGTLAKIDHPLAALMRKFRSARKRCTTYGKDWLKNIADDGRVYPSWKQLGADSGRMSCAFPNMQQLPRGVAYRKCFYAPPGRVLIKADYSQIELRIACKVAGETAMLDAYRRGEDLHTLTARQVLKVEQVSKDDRQLAKALNFGLLYGMGAKGFQDYAKATYNLDLSAEDAQKYRTAFFAAYPGLSRWHTKVKSVRATETRTLSGRRRKLGPKASDNERLNSPIQGTGADGLKLALALLWERRQECHGAFPVLAVHDEIVLEADEGQAEQAAQWLKEIMVEALEQMLDPVPIAVDVKTSKTWAGD